VIARQIEREWLDQLPPHDPRAMRARRDLRRVNSWMLQPTIMARLLRKHACGRPRRMLDLGAGDGTFMLRIARRLRWAEVTLTLVDRHDAVSNETIAGFAEIGWNVETTTADVRDVTQWSAAFDVISANLFLHHLAHKDLVQLLARVAQLAPLFVACEPKRASWALSASRLVWMLGCGEVTRHDAPASVRAGFSGRELSALWPSNELWELDEYGWLFTHCFTARRMA
jgi:2-polyprenyl-3-methyl-5-hydroxy-6-metoxy-1,4-benzoquinol methylase